MPEEEFLIVMTVLIAGIALVFTFAMPLRKALLRKIEAPAPAQDPHLLEEIDGRRDRMGELEERLDFSERLNAQQRVMAGLPPGGSR
jgi:hypothetical protein